MQLVGIICLNSLIGMQLVSNIFSNASFHMQPVSNICFRNITFSGLKLVPKICSQRILPCFWTRTKYLLKQPTALHNLCNPYQISA